MRRKISGWYCGRCAASSESSSAAGAAAPGSAANTSAWRVSSSARFAARSCAKWASISIHPPGASGMSPIARRNRPPSNGRYGAPSGSAALIMTRFRGSITYPPFTPPSSCRLAGSAHHYPDLDDEQHDNQTTPEDGGDALLAGSGSNLTLGTAFDGGDDFVGVLGPGEGLGVGIGLGDEGMDGVLELLERTKGTSCQSALERGSDSLSMQSACYAGATRRARRRSSLARPYIWRLTSLSFVICPSVWPFDQGWVRAAVTAA